MHTRLSNLPWLDQLTIHIPGYEDSLRPNDPRPHERSPHASIRHILEIVCKGLEQVIRECAACDGWDGVTMSQAPGWRGPSSLVESNALTELHSLERAHNRVATLIQSLVRVQQHLDRIVARLQAAGDHAATFEKVAAFFPAETQALTAVDCALMERARALARRFEAPDLQHDFLAKVEDDLSHLEQALDQRALICCRLLEASS
jgi:hypothetical protein